jgi:hypothetical protein
LSDAPKVKKTVRTVNDAVDGMAIGIMICGVLVIALVGWFIFKQMRPRSYTRRYGGGSPLDDPRLRLLMEDMAAEGKKNQAKAEKAAATLDVPRSGAIAPLSQRSEEGVMSR